MRKQFYVYILASGPCGWLYVGVTNDLIRRVAEHKQAIVLGYTRRARDRSAGLVRNAPIYRSGDFEGEADQALAARMEVRVGRKGQSEVAGFVWRAQGRTRLGPVRQSRPGL